MDDVIALACYAIAALAFAAVFGRRYLRTQRALREPVGSDVCVGCGSDLVTTFAPGCHRCAACKFTWGEGLKAHAAQQRAAQLSTLDAAGRRRVAESELARAEERLLEASLALEHAGKQLGPDLLIGTGEGIFGQQDPYSRARTEGLVKAQASMQMAQEHVRRVVEALGQCSGGQSAADAGALDGALLGLDTFMSSELVDIANHLQVDRLKSHLVRMQDDVTRARRRLGAVDLAS